MKAMRKLIAGLFGIALLGSGCDDGRRDYTYCDTTYQECQYGYTCDIIHGICVPKPADAGTPNGNPDAKDANGGDLPSGEARLADTRPLEDGPPDAPGDDATIVDGNPPVDLPPTDSYVPDVPGSCSADKDCVGAASGAFCVKSMCVACKTSAQCDNNAGVPFCSATNMCVGCGAISGPDGGSPCPSTAPVCEASSGRCVECVGNSDCTIPGNGFCVKNRCVGCGLVPDEGTDGGAPDGGVSGACGGATPVCAISGNLAGQCVRCTANEHCSGTTPVCDSANTCVPCTSDSQCTSGPGVCMFTQTGTFTQDGRCASDDETLYVQNGATCDTGADAGTAAKPFCQVQAAMSAVTASRRVIVVSGPGVLSPWSAAPSGLAPPIFVIGRRPTGGSAPIISAGATESGIRVLSGKVYVRGLTVQGAGASALNPGIVVEIGAVLGLDRCTVSGTAGGLLVRDGAGFDIANSIFVQNQPGTGDFGAFGGVSLGSVGTGLPGRFWFNTVAENQAPGVVCTTLTQSLDGVLLWLNTQGDQVHCTLANTSKSGSIDVRDPRFSATPPYHLTLASPCKDFIDGAVPHPSDDFDGQARPRGTKLDCGADEYY